jgi:hypothetical protein
MTIAAGRDAPAVKSVRCVLVWPVVFELTSEPNPWLRDEMSTPFPPGTRQLRRDTRSDARVKVLRSVDVPLRAKYT